MSLTMFVQRQNTTKIWHGVSIWFLWFKEYHFGDREIIKGCLGTLTDAVSLDGDDWWWWWWWWQRRYSNSNSISSRLCTLGHFLIQRQEDPFPGPGSDPLQPILLPWHRAHMAKCLPTWSVFLPFTSREQMSLGVKSAVSDVGCAVGMCSSGSKVWPRGGCFQG